MRADNSSHLIKAARQRAEETRSRAIAALRRMDTAGDPITFDSVARTAGISRSWLYAQPDLRDEIDRLRSRNHGKPCTRLPPQRQRTSDASLLRRLEAATERIRRLEHDNRELRDTLARALGDRRTSTTLSTSRDTPKQKPSKAIGPC